MARKGRKRRKSKGKASEPAPHKLLSRLKSLTDMPKIFKKRRKGRQRMSLNKLTRLIVTINDLEQCPTTIFNSSWMNMRRQRSNAFIRRTNFSCFAGLLKQPHQPEVSHDLEATDGGIQLAYKPDEIYQNVHNPVLLGDDRNGGEDDLNLNNSEGVTEDPNQLNVMAPKLLCWAPLTPYNEAKLGSQLTPDIEAKFELQTPNIKVKLGQVEKVMDKVDCEPSSSKNNKKPMSRFGESLIDILKKRSTPPAVDMKPRMRIKKKKHRPKVFLQRKIAKPFKPQTSKRAKKVKRKLDFLDSEEELKLQEELKNSSSHVESKFQDKAYSSIEMEKKITMNLELEVKSPTLSICKKKRRIRQRPSNEKLSKLITMSLSPELMGKTKIQVHVLGINSSVRGCFLVSDEAVREAMVDFIAKKMSSLQIVEQSSNQLALQLQNVNSCGAVVALKRKTKKDYSKSKDNKAAIDMDVETLRVWDLWMNNKWSESTEAEGSNDPEYMKGQRKIFRERIKAFLDRMHVIQGDRTFSPWKGSVLDSIIGVFLTQNVSDNLSSNAFMDLAAAFPPLSLSEQNARFGHDYPQLTLDQSPLDKGEGDASKMEKEEEKESSPSKNKKSTKKGQGKTMNWEELKRQYSDGISRTRTEHNADSVDWERIRQASAEEVADVIAHRGMSNQLAERIKNFLDRLDKDHGSIDLEWLRNVPPEKAKEFLLSVSGLGLKSTECVRLLSLHFPAFPVDTNACRFFVRVGWVPLKPLPDGVKLHDLNEYPLLDSVQKYMWPRICDYDMLTLYDFHCHSITFSKSFCTKTQPNCRRCPMSGECKHYASSLAKDQLYLVNSQASSCQEAPMLTNSDGDELKEMNEPIVELPASPGPLSGDIEDTQLKFKIPTCTSNGLELSKTTLSVIDNDETSKALVVTPQEVASVCMPQQKLLVGLRTVHQVYELPNSHPLLLEYESREPQDPCPYLLAIWPHETTNTSQGCLDKVCGANLDQDTIKGTILIPCRTANRGRFPLNGTYFQNNEVFADHEGSVRPIDVPREWISNLNLRTLYCGTSITSICKGMTMEEVAYCFRTSYICIRGFLRKSRRPMMLQKKFHICKSRKVGEE